MTSEALDRALRRAEEHLLSEVTPEGLVARRESAAAGDDAAVGVGAAAEVASDREKDGSWGGSLRATAQALLLLRDLDPQARGFGVRRAVENGVQWLRSRRNQPGSYIGGCTPARHAEGLCHHFASGFFAPTAADAAQTDDDRLALSCHALRAWLAWGLAGSDAELHLHALTYLVQRRTRIQEAEPSSDAFLAALAALVAAPSAAHLEAAEHGITILLGTQRADGSWPYGDPFQVLDLLNAAYRRGIGGLDVGRAIDRAAQLLAVTQQTDGTWGRGLRESSTLTGWRALRHALRMTDIVGELG